VEAKRIKQVTEEKFEFRRRWIMRLKERIHLQNIKVKAKEESADVKSQQDCS
jgi:hypothetical protein